MCRLMQCNLCKVFAAFQFNLSRDIVEISDDENQNIKEPKVIGQANWGLIIGLLAGELMLYLELQL